MPIPYPHGDKAKGINPVHNLLFFKVRCDWFEAHHLYWGLIAMAIGAYRFSEGHYIESAVEFLLGLWWAIDDLNTVAGGTVI
jgi:hypothetical protein